MPGSDRIFDGLLATLNIDLCPCDSIDHPQRKAEITRECRLPQLELALDQP